VTDVSPSERELDILKVLWELGEGSVRQVHEKLCPHGECAFNTVQTLLRIMEDKGLVAHRTDGRTFIYRPCFSKEQASSRFLDRVFDGALDQMVLTMLRAQDVSAQELKELEQLIAKARRRRKKDDQVSGE
jgi:BlaI family transcriptional regulator, penicillinase repressor